jgi:MoaA/NifB/PqqE/SkfB family radical SAM enzyme
MIQHTSHDPIACKTERLDTVRTAADSAIALLKDHRAGLITAPVTQNRHHWKERRSAAGIHLFDRITGLNVLLDEVSVPASLHSRAPRQVSIALTNRCDLACGHCYAPKSRDELGFDSLTRWLAELDSQGTLGIGFGGGEPTLYPQFVKLCQHAARETRLSVSFTTHGHHIHSKLAESLRGSVHFIRISMDGVGTTYESIRNRPFPELLARLKNVRSISNFGVNVVVNDRTLPNLDDVAVIAANAGACELLLLPQVPVRGVLGIASRTLDGLRRWVDSYRGSLKICINEASADGFPTCDPLVRERGLRAYAHIDARGLLKPSSYAESGVPLGKGSLLQALDQLTHNLDENNS